MKHFLSIFVFITATLFTYGQTPYTASDFIQGGSSVNYNSTIFADTLAQPISNFTEDQWTFNAPEEFTSTTIRAFLPSEVGADVLFPDAQLCLTYEMLTIPMRILDNKLQILGAMANIVYPDFGLDIDIPITFDVPVDMLRFPLTEGDQINQERTIPMGFKFDELGIDPADFGLPFSPDSVRVNITFALSSEINDYGMFNGRFDAYKEFSEITADYSVDVKVPFLGWLTDILSAEVTSMTSLNYWVPGFGLPACQIMLNAGDSVLAFNIVPEMLASAYATTFVVTDEDQQPIIDATIAINDQTINTNAQGEATIDLDNGEYPYTVTKEGYQTQEGTAEVDNSEQTINVTMEEEILIHTVTFKVQIDAEQPIIDATIDINNQTITTNAQGEATIDLENGEYTYVVNKEGYSKLEGTVTVENSNITEIVTMLLGINDMTAEIKLYPNPATDKLTLNRTGADKALIEIHNSNGIVVCSFETNEAATDINISNLASGVYFIRLINGNQTIISKCFVKI